MTIQPIETTYQGYKFRSRLEARWARFFDNLRIEWHYEYEGYETPYGRYVPDFWLPNVYLRNKTVKGILFEVKPDQYGSEHDALAHVAHQLKVGAMLANGYKNLYGDEWQALYEISPDWDEPMLIYVCSACRAVKFEFCEGSYMNCPVCGKEDFHGTKSIVESAFEEALRFRFW